jgi:hypothetical protein
MDWLDFPAHWMRRHIPEMAFSITAMLLVVSGPSVNAGLKNMTRKFHWLLRYCLFVILTTLGYGLVGNFILQKTRGVLWTLSDGLLVGLVLGLHLLLAWMLKRDRRI